MGRLQALQARRHPKQLCNDNNWIQPVGMSQEAASLPKPDRCLIVQLSTHCAHNFIFERHIYPAQLPIVWLFMQKALLEIDENIFLLQGPLRTPLMAE